ncbi:protein JINGUBANG [Macadamia integrifolia]|uniref:protein JINGUBANG n=1 Tax=Macadamia integrifolia TaxID=60698 RepID=UPI001C4E65E8|nr:protein JINGUBANG [Macadamia integrifolia]
MTVRTWEATCSSTFLPSTANDAGASIQFPHKKLQLLSPNLSASDIRSSSEIQTSPPTSQENSFSSPRSNFSIQSLPSVPSLQSICSETTHNNVSVSYLCVSILKPQTHRPISCLAVYGDLLYAASGDEINVYTLTNYQHIDTFNGKDPSSGSVKSVTFGEGKVFTAHLDCKIRVWLTTPEKHHRLVATLPTVKDRLRRLVIPKNYVRVRRHKKRLWIEHFDAVSGLSMTDGLLYSVSWDKSLKIWRTSNLRCLESVKAHDDAVNAIAVSDDGTVYTASADRRIRVWGRAGETKRHELIATLDKHQSAVNALVLSSDGSTLFSGAGDRSILVWEREDSVNHMGVIGALRGHKGAILCLINVSDVLVSGSEDRTVRIWRRGVDQGYICLVELKGHERPVKSLVAVMEGIGTVSPPPSVTTISVCSGSLDGEIRVWEVTVPNVKATSSSFTSESDLTDAVLDS